jgi:hypothetical protein
VLGFHSNGESLNLSIIMGRKGEKGWVKVPKERKEVGSIRII